jgi:hypothetical protein
MIEKPRDNKAEIVVGSLVKVDPDWIPDTTNPELNARDTYKVIIIDENQKGPETYWICPTDLPEADVQAFLAIG